MIDERETMMENNIRLQIIGQRERIPADVQKEMDKSLEMTAGNTGTCLCLAINYGGRAEIVCESAIICCGKSATPRCG